MEADTRQPLAPDDGTPPNPRRPRRGRRSWILRTVVLLVVAALTWTVSVPVRVWWDARQEDRRPSDAIVVLGAAQYDGRPSAVFEARLEKAMDLFEAGVAPVVVTVGGSRPGDRVTEAEAGRDWLLGAGLSEEEVVAVSTGANTQASLSAIGDLFEQRGWSSAVLVTDPWHTFRSKALARDAGIDAVAAPARSGPVVRTRAAELRYILRESAAYIRWRLTGESGSGGPAAF